MYTAQHALSILTYFRKYFFMFQQDWIAPQIDQSELKPMWRHTRFVYLRICSVLAIHQDPQVV